MIVRFLVLALAALLAAGGVVRAESVGSLEARAKSFYDLIEKGEKTRATDLLPALERDLDDAQKRLQDEVDDARSGSTPGDDESDEPSAPAPAASWKDAQVRLLLVQYHLAWVRYQGAQLLDDGDRKRSLLRKSIEDFARFASFDEIPDIAAEAEYGQGLAFLDLGDWAKATEHLQAAAKYAKIAPKAKAALAEVKRRAAGGKPDAVAPEPQKAPEITPESLQTELEGLLPKAAAGDAGAEKRATELARGLAARGGAWPSQIAATVAKTLGDGSAASVRSSYGVYLLAQLALDQNRCGELGALAAASEKPTDGGRARYRPEVLFMDAGCKLNAGKHREAADGFATLLKEFPESSRARESAYYRIRALDSLRGADASATAPYEDALRAYLDRFGKTDAAGEMHFRLGELYRTQTQCAKAAPEFAKVGAGTYAVRAQLGGLECRVAEITAKKDATADERKAVVEALRGFVRATPPRGDDEGHVAEAALLGALVAAKGTTPDHAAVIEFTDGFEGKFPSAKTYFAQALELRLKARVALGQTAEVARDLDAFVKAGALDGERRKLLAQVARDLASQAERSGTGTASAAAGVARTAYGALVASGGTDSERIQLADLTERTGDAAGARQLYDAVLTAKPDSAEALRGAARAAATLGDRAGALAYWKRVVDGTTAGGTAWYEARVAQVQLLAEMGEKSQACELARGSRGRATTTGGDTLATKLRQVETELCK